MHVVRRGETLSAIARRYGLSTAALVRHNRLADADRIDVGQRLTIPGTAPSPRTTKPKAGLVKAPVGPVRATGSLAWPLKGRVVRRYGQSVGGQAARGIAIQGKRGADVRAADSGSVVLCRDHVRGYGRTVVLDHGNGWTTVYANNDALLVREGQTVRKGDTIARAGSTGRATGCQLEFRVYRWGAPQNPERLLP